MLADLGIAKVGKILVLLLRQFHCQAHRHHRERDGNDPHFSVAKSSMWIVFNCSYRIMVLGKVGRTW